MQSLKKIHFSLLKEELYDYQYTKHAYNYESIWVGCWVKTPHSIASTWCWLLIEMPCFSPHGLFCFLQVWQLGSHKKHPNSKSESYRSSPWVFVANPSKPSFNFSIAKNLFPCCTANYLFSKMTALQWGQLWVLSAQLYEWFQNQGLSSPDKVHFQVNKSSPVIVFRRLNDWSNGGFLLWSREVNLTKSSLLTQNVNKFIFNSLNRHMWLIRIQFGKYFKILLTYQQTSTFQIANNFFCILLMLIFDFLEET